MSTAGSYKMVTTVSVVIQPVLDVPELRQTTVSNAQVDSTTLQLTPLVSTQSQRIITWIRVIITIQMVSYSPVTLDVRDVRQPQLMIVRIVT